MKPRSQKTKLRLASRCAVGLALLLCVGCASHHGLPNFSHVSGSTYRCGQPDGAGWETAREMFGRKILVIQLNAGRDEIAERMGFRVVYLPINYWEQMFSGPHGQVERAIAEIEAAEADGWTEIVHCKNGWDRTGLVCGDLRMTREHWSKADAYAEMRAMGFHPLLFGLKRSWDSLPERSAP